MTAPLTGMGRPKRPRRAIHVPEVAPVARVAAVLAAFLLGMWGFSVAYARLGQHPGLVSEAWLAVRLIVGNFPDELEGRDLPLSLDIARWALPLLTFWSSMALAWAQIRNPLRIALMRHRGEHLVVAGDAGLARQLAASELNEGRRVLLWSTDRRADWVADALDLGAGNIEAKGETLSVEKLGLDKARGAVLVAPDDSGNTALVARVMAQAALGRPAGDPLNVIARIDNLDLRRGVEERFDRADRSAARVRFVSLPDIAARELFVERPLDGFRRLGDPGRTLFILGYSPVIVRYLLRLLAGGHFRDGVKPRIIIVDPRSEESKAAFQMGNPGADQLSPVIFEQAAIDQAAQGGRIIADLTQRHGQPVAIVIDCGDDARSLALALAIDTHYASADAVSPPIHVHLRSQGDAGLSVSLHGFGGLDNVADPEMLLQERHDALARSIHDFYLEGRLEEGGRLGSRASMREWEDLPETFRDDNRLVADCYQLKLRDIGARLVDGAGTPLRFDDAELEELSRAEHDRWMAAKLVGGWVYGPTRDDAARLHPDIVPYDDLSEAIKDLDREQIRVMTRLLGVAGRRAVRVLSVGLDPGDGPGLAAGLAGVLQRLTEHYPDRVPLVTGVLAHAPSREALLAAAALGLPVRLFVSGNIQALIDTLPAGQRGPVCALVRDADSIVAVSAAGDAPAALHAEAALLLATAPIAGASCPVVILDGSGAIVESPWRR